MTSTTVNSTPSLQETSQSETPVSQKTEGEAPLTPEEIKLVRSHWEVVKNNIKEIGYDLFIRFFTENPTYQAYFKSFAKVPLAELRGNKRVSAHANSVLYTLTAMIDELEDIECFVEMTVKLAESHHRRKLSITQFERLGVTLIGLLKEKLGEEVMDEKACAIWEKTYGILLKLVSQKFAEIEQSK